jgi:hypothetical protein
MKIIIMLSGLLHNNYYILELRKNRNWCYYNISNFNKLYIDCCLNDINLSYLLKKTTTNIIILEDVKLLVCEGKFKIENKSYSDHFKIIEVNHELHSNSILKIELKEAVLINTLSDYLYFLENSYDLGIVKNIIDILEISISLGINIHKYYDYFMNNLKKYKLNMRDIVYLLNNCNINDFNIYKKMLNDLLNVEFNNSLLSEMLCFITVSDLKYSRDLLNLLIIDDIIRVKKFKVDENMKDESTDLYNSIISRTDWKEELNYGNIMGLLINIKPTELNKCYFSFENIEVNNVTTSIVGLDQVIESYKLVKDFDVSISGNGIGNGNCILPLYIDEIHWNLVKLYQNYNFGLLFNRNPLLYCNDMNKVYKVVLLKMINLTFSDKDYRSDKWINLLFSLFFTTTKLFNKKEYIKNLELRDRYKLNINDLLYDYLLCDDDNDYKYIVEELIRRCFKKMYKNIDILDSIYNIGHIDDAMENKILISEINYKKWLNDIEMNNIFIETIKLIYGVYKMKNIISDKYLKSVLSNEDLVHIKDYVKKNEIKVKSHELYGLLNNNFNHTNYCKTKTYSIKILFDIGIVRNKEELRSMLIQCMMQRVNKLAKRNINYIDPFSENSKLIIVNNYSIFKQRYIKKLFGLGNLNDYIRIINCIELFRLKFFLDVMVNNTICLKNQIKSNIELIKFDRRKYIL